jgi:hypothetical protein
MKHDVTSARRQRGRRALVAVQLVLSLVLLLPSALLVRGLANAHAVRLGFNPDRVYTIALEPRLAGLGEARTRRFHEDLQRRLAAVPGVSATSFALYIPLGDRGDALPIRPGGSKDLAAHSIPYNGVTPGYLEMLDIPLVRGRVFTPGDEADSPWVAVVNQAFASRMWPGRSRSVRSSASGTNYGSARSWAWWPTASMGATRTITGRSCISCTASSIAPTWCCT